MLRKAKRNGLEIANLRDVENLDWRSIYLLPRNFQSPHPVSTGELQQTPFCLKSFRQRSLLLLPQIPGNANPPVLGLPGNKCFLEKRTIFLVFG